jgi:branched-chain amino acid aminotransferase
MLDHLGAVAECTGANLFIVVGETVVTPTTRAALPGITRRTVLEICAEQGIATEERDVWPAELHCCDGAFVCGSGAGIVPIGSFDGRPVTQPEHPIIARIQEAYRSRTRSAEYRTEVYIPVP